MSLSYKRRQMLKLLSAAGISGIGGFSLFQQAKAQTIVNDKVNIVIAGAGLAGIATANRLRKQLPNAKITIIDAKTEHNYQPGYTLLATGVWKTATTVKSQNADYIPAGVDWVQSAVSEIEAPENRVRTANGQSFDYDFLVVATGLRLGYEQIEGLDVAAFGQKGLGSVYASPEVAVKTWQAMDSYRHQGGRAVMTLAPTFIKCAGAPLKMTFMLQDRLQQLGVGKDNAQIDFFSPSDVIFSVPPVNDDVLKRWQQLPIAPQVHNHYTLKAVDMDKQTAYFIDPQGNTVGEDYNFLHVVPPMYAPEAVSNSNLVVSDGVQKGWLDVNQETLQHTRYSNVFGVGDINGTPRGKTAATVKKSVPMMVENLLQTIQGKEPTQLFDGYTSCPLLIREGSALLVEFNGAGKLTPTIPGVEPLTDSYLAWFIEDVMLKPAYMAVLKGRIN